ncbi:MAG: Flp pilus assembly complex ATPase component TadA [Bifidobacteriaceae bacterium]|jgi:type IV pilus assembly protein PilB|nr:Flp pilus assembly complex ATPase component TadA [Bifidobacteriaceae bacterium]
MSALEQTLLSRGLVSRAQLDQASRAQAMEGVTLGQALVASGALKEEDLIPVLAEAAGLRFVDLDVFPVDARVAGSVPGNICRRHMLLPVAREGDAVVVAMAEPGNIVAIDDVRSYLGAAVVPAVAERGALDRAIRRFVRSDSEIDSIGQSLDSSVREEERTATGAIAEVVQEDSPVVRWVHLLISQAIHDGCSDIHLEPEELDLRVRYRIDGVLHEMQSAPKSIQTQVISRIKIMADIDIAERRKPQDGRISINVDGNSVDLRVATLPTVWGEKVVLRILNTAAVQVDLRKLSFSEASFSRYKKSYSKPYGMILATGPTGSGKSTTLYATLKEISRPEVNVITIEDPVEYRMSGINQIQVNPKAGLTFAAALRSILRADPDVVLVGEIRDGETAQIAVEAALTGHLVLSTLHTNDAPSAVTRLTEMGIEPFLVASALDCVVAQRLARRLCERCREPYSPSDAEVNLLREDWIFREPPPPQLYRPIGCSACANTGFKGRLAVHEVMTVSKELEHLTALRKSTRELNELAREQGMISLRQDGWAKVAQGQTSVEELLRVVA